MYTIKLSKRAIKDRTLIKQAGYENKARALLDILEVNPFQTPPMYEILIGNLNGYYSRRINIQHRLVYRIDEENKTVFVFRMWTHYE